MSEDLPVQASILSSSPCTVKDAAALLGKFLQSDSVPETGLLRGYLESVTSCLGELASRQPPQRKEKKSRKHREVDHQGTDVQEHVTTSGLDAEAVISETEQQNGYKKRSGKKRKGTELDAEAVTSELEQQNGYKKRPGKKRKGTELDAEVVTSELEQQNGYKKRPGKKRKGTELDSEAVISEPEQQNGYQERPGKKRKDRGLDVGTDVTEIREKKRKKRIEQ